MHRAIFRLAIPNIISNISIPLLSTVDVALMGGLSARHLGAIGLASMIFNFIFWNFGFLRMGTTGLTAQAYGADARDEIVDVLRKGLMLALSIALIILVFQRPLIALSVDLMGVPQGEVDLVYTYMSYRIWDVPATLLLYALMGWFFGMQNAWIPLIITVVVNTINIVLSYVWVVHYQWDIKGVALGTVVAQYFGLLLAIVLLSSQFRSVFKALARPMADTKLKLNWVHFLSVNRYIFLRTLCLTLAFALFYRRSAMLGVQLLAVHVVGLQLLNWMSYGIDGFAYAAESLTGRFKGAQDRNRFNIVVRQLFFWGLGLALCYAIIYGFLIRPIARIFSNDTGIIERVVSMRWWFIILPIAGFASYLWDGIYIGITAVRSMFLTMLIAFFSYIIVIYGPHVGTESFQLWLALVLFLVIRSISQHILFHRYHWHLQ